VARKKPDSQLDLFIADLVDVPTKGQRETLSLPFFELGKRKRARMTYDHDGVVVDVSAPTHIGIANIYDGDFLLWAASELIAARERGRDVSERLRFTPYELLKATGRGTSGKAYNELRASLSRLTATSIKTNVTHDGGETKSMFNWLQGWREETDAKGVSKWFEVVLPKWFFNAVMDGVVLTLAPEYFQISGGIERWLYRLVRRHAGHQETGWTFSMAELHRKSGTTQPMKHFSYGLRKIVTANALPEYDLALVDHRGRKGVRAIRRDLLSKPK